MRGMHLHARKAARPANARGAGETSDHSANILRRHRHRRAKLAAGQPQLDRRGRFGMGIDRLLRLAPGMADLRPEMRALRGGRCGPAAQRRQQKPIRLEGAPDLDHEIRRFEWKVEAGAEYAITQPVFDVKQLKDFLKRIEHCRIPIVPGIWPLTSFRNAEFLNNEVPGVSVPPDILERMRKAEDGAAALKEGVKIAQEMLLEVREYVQGVQVSAPFGKIPHALEVFEVLT